MQETEVSAEPQPAEYGWHIPETPVLLTQDAPVLGVAKTEIGVPRETPKAKAAMESGNMIRIVREVFILTAAGSEPLHGRLDTPRDRLCSKQDECADSGPQEHLLGFGDLRLVPLRRDELEADKDVHKNNDNRTDAYDEPKDIDKEIA